MNRTVALGNRSVDLTSKDTGGRRLRDKQRVANLTSKEAWDSSVIETTTQPIRRQLVERHLRSAPHLVQGVPVDHRGFGLGICGPATGFGSGEGHSLSPLSLSGVLVQGVPVY